MSQTFKIMKRDLHETPHTIRQNDCVTGVIYGASIDENIQVKILRKDLLAIFRNNTNSSVITLDIENTIENCVIKEVQKNNFGKAIHIDFQAISKNEVVKLHIPIVFLGEDTVSEKGLVFKAVETVVELHGPVEKMPEKIEFDVSQLEVDGRILAKDIKLDKEIIMAMPLDTVLGVVGY